MTKQNGKTQIEITIETRAKLRELRICNRESYDEVINRFIAGGKQNGKEIQG